MPYFLPTHSFEPKSDRAQCNTKWRYTYSQGIMHFKIDPHWILCDDRSSDIRSAFLMEKLYYMIISIFIIHIHACMLANEYSCMHYYYVQVWRHFHQNTNVKNNRINSFMARCSCSLPEKNHRIMRFMPSGRINWNRHWLTWTVFITADVVVCLQSFRYFCSRSQPRFPHRRQLRRVVQYRDQQLLLQPDHQHMPVPWVPSHHHRGSHLRWS